VGRLPAGGGDFRGLFLVVVTVVAVVQVVVQFDNPAVAVSFDFFII